MASGRSDCAVTSRLERGRHAAGRRLGQRQCQWHRWQAGPRRCMDGIPVERWWGRRRRGFSCWRRGRELEEYDCAQTSTERRRVARGSSTNMVGVSLCLTPRIPTWQLEMGWPRLPSGSGLQSRSQFRSQTTAHLTSPTDPSPTRGPFLFADVTPPVIIRHSPSSYLLSAHLTHLSSS